MNREEKNIIDEAFVYRYLQGEGTEEDKRKIGEWFALKKDPNPLKEISYQYWKKFSIHKEFEDYDEERLLDRINHLLRIEDARVLQKKRTGLNRLIIYIGRIAAGLFIPLLLFSYLQWNGFFDTNKPVAYSSIYSPLGARTNFHLPDGSEGWLNGGSTLYFPAEFSGQYREVRLEGEAFFEVVENPDIPFVVIADKIRITALGTSFNVNAYKEDETSQVTLESGVVELYKAEDQGLRRPLNRMGKGFQFVYFKELDSFVTQKADMDKTTSWKDGKLVFREDPLTEVVNRLKRWYNVNILIEDKALENYSYRATFEDETLDEILKLLKLSSPIVVKDLGREMLDDDTFGKRTIVLSLK